MKHKSISIVLLTALLSNATSAQPTDNKTPVQNSLIEQLLVVGQSDGYESDKSRTATRLNALIEDIPINLQIITRDLINDFELTSQRDALQFTSAVDDKRVRGFNTGEFFRNGFLHLSDTPGYVIERMEILRGPTAVLNGPTTSGGAINVLTKQARLDQNSSDIAAYFGKSGSSRDNYGINADINFGEIFGNAEYGSTGALRLVGGFQEDTGFATDVDNRSSAILPSLAWRPTEDTYLNAEYYGYEISTDRADRPMAAELYIPGAKNTQVSLAQAYAIDPRSSWFAPNTDIEETVDDISLSAEHALSDKLLTSLRYNTHQRDFKFGPGQRPRIDIFFGLVQVSGDEGSTNPSDYRIKRRSEFLQLQNDVDQIAADFTFLAGWDHSFTAGFSSYSQNQDLLIQRPFIDADGDGAPDSWMLELFDPAQIDNDRRSGRLNFNPTGKTLDIRSALDRTEEISLDNIYLNYSGKWFNDSLSVIGGLTYSDIELARSQALDSRPNITANSKLLPQIGAVYKATEQVSLYGNYSESQLPDINDPDFSVARIRSSDQIEAGVRLQLLEASLGVNLGFYQIEQTVTGTNFQTAKASGLDFDIYYAPNDGLEIIAGWSNNDTQVTASSNSGELDDPLVDEIPKKFSVIGKYKIKQGALGGLSLGGAFTWLGERPRPTTGASNVIKKDANGSILNYNSETRFDLFASYTARLNDTYRYELALNLRNLSEDANISNTVPRVPLQGGVDALGNATSFNGHTEVMLRLRIISQ